MDSICDMKLLSWSGFPAVALDEVEVDVDVVGVSVVPELGAVVVGAGEVVVVPVAGELTELAPRFGGADMPGTPMLPRWKQHINTFKHMLRRHW